ncbi:MAG: ribonuclease H-like domain-containing protein [Bacillota bacterium]|nr:ribonuclease H-like domain-containing protein [Bacillota bacterium]
MAPPPPKAAASPARAGSRPWLRSERLPLERVPALEAAGLDAEPRRGLLPSLVPLEGSPRAWGYLDVETTGLGRGAGTLVFLVGLAWWEEGELVIRQHLLPDPAEEAAWLEGVAADVAGQAWVTFNGDRFDLPLLAARWLLSHGPGPGPNPFAAGREGPGGWDLLPLARLLWGRRVGRSSLAALEERVLGLRRDGDLPGSQAPARYLAYLNGGGADLLDDVAAHNRADLISLVALTSRVAALLACAEPEALPGWAAEGLGRRARSTREPAAAALLARAFRAAERPGERLRAGRLLARELERRRRWEEAAAVWEELLAVPALAPFEAYVALAKLYEHRLRRPERALEVVERARRVEAGRRLPGVERRLEELERRRRRLERRLGHQA